MERDLFPEVPYSRRRSPVAADRRTKDAPYTTEEIGRIKQAQVDLPERRAGGKDEQPLARMETLEVADFVHDQSRISFRGKDTYLIMRRL